MTQKTLQPVETKKIAVKFKGNQVVQMKYGRKKGFTRDEILKAAQEYSNKLKEKGFDGQVAVSIKYHDKDNGQWRGGYSRPVGKDVLIYSHHDSDTNEKQPDSFPEFRIYTIKNGTKIGKAIKTMIVYFVRLKIYYIMSLYSKNLKN